jgi:16S rRNA (uracil1498-N3)-methyltransferase
MRARVGDELTLFDGSGAEFSARIEQIGRSEVILSALERHEVDRELSIRIVLGVALPKGDRQRWLVEKLVELGVAELVPLVTARSVAQPSGNALERLRRTVIEASKQCGRNRLMAIGPAQPIAELLAETPDSAARLIADRRAEAESATAWTIPASEVVGTIGPEGGFTDEELALAHQHQWNKVSLGPCTLRTETAAAALATVIAWQCKTDD